MMGPPATVFPCLFTASNAEHHECMADNGRLSSSIFGNYSECVYVYLPPVNNTRLIFNFYHPPAKKKSAWKLSNTNALRHLLENNNKFVEK
jgi:hypothetical protein